MFSWLRKKRPPQLHDEAETLVATNGSAPFNFDIVTRTDIGCRREGNEDAVDFARPDDAAELALKGTMVVVADGMGGHAAGEVASALAIETIREAYYASSADIPTALERAFLEANRAIQRAARGDKSKHGMGTTAVALLLRGDQAFAAHVGDSRLYLIRDGEIFAMTEDHSAVMEMVKQGIIDKETARHHPQKNVILRALGTNPEVEVSVWREPSTMRAGDCFLLCSDGLSDQVEDGEMRDALRDVDLETAAARLIELARERGGPDNITLALVAVRSRVEVAKAPPPTRVLAAPDDEAVEAPPETREHVL